MSNQRKYDFSQNDTHIIDLEQYYQQPAMCKEKRSDSNKRIEIEIGSNNYIHVNNSSSDESKQSKQVPQIQKQIQKNKFNNSDKWSKQHKKINLSEKLSKSVMDVNKPTNIILKKSIDFSNKGKIISESNEKSYRTQTGNFMNKTFFNKSYKYNEDLEILESYDSNKNNNTPGILSDIMSKIQEENPNLLDQQNNEIVYENNPIQPELDDNKDIKFYTKEDLQKEKRKSSYDQYSDEDNRFASYKDKNPVIIIKSKNHKDSIQRYRKDRHYDHISNNDNQKESKEMKNITKTGNYMYKVYVNPKYKYSEEQKILEHYDPNTNNNTQSIFNDIMDKIQKEDPHLLSNLQNDERQQEDRNSYQNFNQKRSNNQIEFKEDINSQFWSKNVSPKCQSYNNINMSVNDEEQQRLIDQRKKSISISSDEVILSGKTSPFMKDNPVKSRIKIIRNDSNQTFSDFCTSANKSIQQHQNTQSNINGNNTFTSNTNSSILGYVNNYQNSSNSTFHIKPQEKKQNSSDPQIQLSQADQYINQKIKSINEVQKCIEKIKEQKTAHLSKKYIIKIKKHQNSNLHHQKLQQNKSPKNNQESIHQNTFFNSNSQNYNPNLINSIDSSTNDQSITQNGKKYKLKLLNQKNDDQQQQNHSDIISNTTIINPNNQLMSNLNQLPNDQSKILPSFVSFQDINNFSNEQQQNNTPVSPIRNQIQFISQNVFSSPEEQQMQIKSEFQGQEFTLLSNKSDKENIQDESNQVHSFIPLPCIQKTIEIIIEDNKDEPKSDEIESSDFIIEEEDNQQSKPQDKENLKELLGLDIFDDEKENSKSQLNQQQLADKQKERFKKFQMLLQKKQQKPNFENHQQQQTFSEEVKQNLNQQEQHYLQQREQQQDIQPVHLNQSNINILQSYQILEQQQHQFQQHNLLQQIQQEQQKQLIQQQYQQQQQQQQQHQQQQQQISLQNPIICKQEISNKPNMIVNTFFNSRQQELQQIQELTEEDLYQQYEDIQSKMKTSNINRYFQIQVDH